MTTTVKSATQLDNLGKTLCPFGQQSRAGNQRLAMRYELRAWAEFCWIDDEGVSRHGTGFTRDISTKGAYILGGVLPPKGTPIALNIDIKFSASNAVRVLRVQTEGHVARVEQPGNDGAESGFSVQNDRVTSFQG